MSIEVAAVTTCWLKSLNKWPGECTLAIHHLNCHPRKQSLTSSFLSKYTIIEWYSLSNMFHHLVSHTTCVGHFSPPNALCIVMHLQCKNGTTTSHRIDPKRRLGGPSCFSNSKEPNFIRTPCC